MSQMKDLVEQMKNTLHLGTKPSTSAASDDAEDDRGMLCI